MLIAKVIGQNVLLNVKKQAKGHGLKRLLNLVQVQLALLPQRIVVQGKVVVSMAA
tara:strand:+ start:310 stop:474 length:165 start_codon:yes stop_codon:yes gene_type:complete